MQSSRAKNFARIFLFICLIICFATMLPPIITVLFSFINNYIPDAQLRLGSEFGNRLQSMLSLPFFGFVFFLWLLSCLFSKTIDRFFFNANYAKYVLTIAIGILFAMLIFTSVYSYKYGRQWLNSDHASEMILGRLLAEENVLVSPNWRYSTEIRLIYQTLFTMPLFKLLGNLHNWALIRSIAIFLNNIVLLLSYIFLSKQLKIRTKWIITTSIFLYVPISFLYWDIVIYGGYYLFFIAQLFCSLGLFLKIINNASEKGSTVTFILFTALSFVLGIQGIRALYTIYIPLFIACFYLYSKTFSSKKLPLFLGVYGFGISCLGFVGSYLLHFKYSFHSFDSMQIENLYENFLPKLGQCLVSFSKFFGLSTGHSLLSAIGLFSVFAIIGTFSLFGVIISQFNRKKKQFLPIFFLISVIFNIFVFIIIDEGITDRYFIPFMVLYVPLAAMLLEYIESAKTYSYLKRTVLFCGIILFIFGQSYLNFQYIANRDVNSIRKNYINYLLDNQLYYGVATFWNANVTTELSNGRINTVGTPSDSLEPDHSAFRIHNWLIPIKYTDPSWYDGESFLLLTHAEWEMAQKTERPFASFQPDFMDNNFIVLRFPSAKILYDVVLDK